jgi:septal ring factor EnvC (AmiA/AmiB activator)
MRFFPVISGKLLLCLPLVWLTLSFSPVAAEDELDSSRQRLDTIQKQIEKTLESLRSKESEKGVLSEDLDRLNNEVRRLARIKKKSGQKLAALTDQLNQMRQELKDLEKDLVITEKQIRLRLVVLYKTGEVGLIKALLSASESPRNLAEKYAFLSRMVRHDRELLSDYREQALKRQSAVENLEALQSKQAKLVLQREKEQKILQRASKDKKILLVEVKKDTELLATMLEELKAKAARLNDLVKKLETEQSRPYTGSLEGIQAHKGRLLWPVAGKLRVGFGTSRDAELGTLIESHGYEIESDVGAAVNASANGKIIFANSLRGYGKLMILDHGNKYYSLYAHISRFAKQVGDVVAAAETIAYSGFEGRDTVYFEIRKGGKPLDPGNWLKPR